MKNKKIIVVFILIIAYLFVMLAGVKATNPLPLFNNEEPNTQEPTTAPTPTPEPSQTPTQIPTPTPTPTPTPSNNGNNTPTNSLPDTGVAEDTALFVFITICIASSIYAFVKIRNYKNV